MLVLLPAAAPAQNFLPPGRPVASSEATPGLVVPAPYQGSSREPAPPSRPVQYGAGMGGSPDDNAGVYQIPTEPPGNERLFRLESEADLHERMRQEALGRPGRERISFPDEPILSRDTYAGRTWPKACRPVEPYYVCYDRLLFEEKSYERYGWDLGILTPVLATTEFFALAALLPYNIGRDPCRYYEASGGYCLPGDPVPLMLYPLGFSVGGSLAEAATVVALIAVFP